MFNGQTGARCRHGQLRAGPRHHHRLGRQLRQPRRPFPRRHRLPGRPAPQHHHGARLLRRARRSRPGTSATAARPSGGCSTAPTPATARTQGGHHSLSIADVDGNGRQEIVYGAHDHQRQRHRALHDQLYAHGDALHVGDFVPSRAGLEIWMIHERLRQPAAALRDADTGARSSAIPNNSGDEGPGRGVAGDIYAGNAGAEFWGAGAGMTNLFNAVRRQRRAHARLDQLPGLVGRATPFGSCSTATTSTNTAPAATRGCYRLRRVSINGTKATPNLSRRHLRRLARRGDPAHERTTPPAHLHHDHRRRPTASTR